MKEEHIHTPDDGRGLREVWVDGKKVDAPIFADTKRGIVDCYRVPLKLDKWGKRILSRRLRGAVVVKPIC